jgi:hypothetical protein
MLEGRTRRLLAGALAAGTDQRVATPAIEIGIVNLIVADLSLRRDVKLKARNGLAVARPRRDRTTDNEIIEAFGQ